MRSTLFRYHASMKERQDQSESSKNTLSLLSLLFYLKVLKHIERNLVIIRIKRHCFLAFILNECSGLVANRTDPRGERRWQDNDCCYSHFLGQPFPQVPKSFTIIQDFSVGQNCANLSELSLSVGNILKAEGRQSLQRTIHHK